MTKEGNEKQKERRNNVDNKRSLCSKGCDRKATVVHTTRCWNLVAAQLTLTRKRNCAFGGHFHLKFKISTKFHIVKRFWREIYLMFKGVFSFRLVVLRKNSSTVYRERKISTVLLRQFSTMALLVLLQQNNAIAQRTTNTKSNATVTSHKEGRPGIVYSTTANP